MKRWVWVLPVLLALSPVARAADKESYLKKTETELKEWSSKVEKLQKQSEKAGTKTRVEFERQVRNVRQKIAVAGRKLEELQESNQGTWKTLRQNADEALRDVKRAFRTAKSYLNQDEHKEE